MEEEKKTPEVNESEVKETKKKKVENVSTETTKKPKNTKKIILIAIITLVVIIAAAVGGYFAYDYYETNKSVGTEWGDIYVSYFEGYQQTSDDEKTSKYGIMEHAENVKIQVYQNEENQAPNMVIKYEVNGNKFITNWTISEEKDTPDVKTFFGKDDIKLLYNIEKQDYEWYYYEENDEGDKLYTEVIATGEVLEDGTQMHKIYNFTAEDLPKEEETTTEGELPTISKFEKTFIVPEVSEIKEVEIDLNSDIKELKKAVKETVVEYKSQDETLTEEVKAEVEKEKTELSAKQKEIRKAEEEAKRIAEEEAKKKAEEEAARKAAEEAAKGFKAGSYRLQYGTYKSIMPEAPYTFVLKSDGTFTYSGADLSTGSGNYNLTGTFTAVRQDIYGYGDIDDGIKFTFSNGKAATFVVSSNNAFSSDWLGFTYKGN